MTSSSLQKEHYDVYQHFFAKHDLVLSLPQTFDRGYSWNVEFDSIVQVKQKLPTKMYLWVTFEWEKWFILDEATLYDFQNRCFEKNLFSDLYQWSISENIVNVIESFFKKVWLSWVKVSILSEFRRWEWSWFSSTLSTLFALFMFVYTHNVNPDKLSKKEVLWIWKVALTIESKAFWLNHHVWWFLPYVSLINSDFPQAYCGWSIFENDRFQLSSQVFKDKIIDFKSFSFTDDFSRIWLDLWIIDTNQTYLPRLKKIWHQRKESSFTFLNNVISNVKEIKPSLYLSEIYKYHQTFFVEMFLRYLQKPDKTSIDRLISSLKKLELPTQLTFNSQSAYDQTLPGKFDKIAFIPLSPDRWEWRFLCISKKWWLKKVAKSFINHLKEKTWREISFSYSNWRDWTQYWWWKIEQFLWKKIYSDYIKKGTVIYTSIEWEKKIVSITDAIKMTSRWFLLDGISKKIYFDWERLTSKDLVSQSTTVDLLLMLFDNLNQDIPNTLLERSSYSRNKNEMLSKVILPFKKFVELKTKKKLSLDCTWWLYDFMIRMGQTDIPFSRISRVGESIAIS